MIPNTHIKIIAEILKKQKDKTMSKKKIKKCSYLSGVESWKNKRQQKEEIDKRKQAEALDKILELLQTERK